MIVFCGTRLYGKVDHVPGLFYVASHFFYIQFVPLFPTSSYLILDGTEASNGFKGVQIPMSGWSVLVGYFRAGLILAAGVMFGYAAYYWGARQSADAVVSLVCAGGTVAVTVASYWCTRPSLPRALFLAKQANIPLEVVARLFVESGLISTDQLQNLGLDDLQRDEWDNKGRYQP